MSGLDGHINIKKKGNQQIKKGVFLQSKDFAYVVETGKSFEEAVVSVLKAVEQKGWAVFQVYDIKERLAAKGFEQEPLKIIEICSAKHANRFLDKNRLVSICLPCKINVLQENGKVRIAGMRPSMVSEFFPEISREDALEAEKEIKEIIENAK